MTWTCPECGRRTVLGPLVTSTLACGCGYVCRHPLRPAPLSELPGTFQVLVRRSLRRRYLAEGRPFDYERDDELAPWAR